MKDRVGRSLSTNFMKVRKTYEDMLAAVKRRIPEELADRWKKMETHSVAYVVRLAVCARDALLRRSWNVQSSLRKDLDIFSSRNTKPLDVYRSNSLSVCKKAV